MKGRERFSQGPSSTCAHHNAVSFGLFWGCWENRKRRRKKVEEKLTGLWSLIVGGVGFWMRIAKAERVGWDHGRLRVECERGAVSIYFITLTPESCLPPLFPCTNTMPLFINSFLWLDLPVFFLPFFLYFSFSSHLSFWLHASFEFELPEGITFHLKTRDVTKHIVWMVGNCLQV